MTSFFTSIIYNGVDIGTGGGIANIATDGTDIYGSYTSDEHIVKVDGTGTTTPYWRVPTYGIRGMFVALGYIFVINHDGNTLDAYLMSNPDSLPQSVSTLTNPHGLCSDWDGHSSSFKLYFTHENAEPRIGYCTFSSNTLGSVSYFSSHIGGTPDDRLDIVFRKYGSYKYLYATTVNSYLIQMDITNLGAVGISSILLAGTSVSWGLVSNPLENYFYIGELAQNGIIAYPYTPNATTGSITTFGTYSYIINEAGTTSVSNGASAGTQYVAAEGMSYNITSHGINLYVATEDNLIVKLYPSGSNGTGGDPHVLPLIGELYTIDNAVKYVNLFENIVGPMKVKIIGETWLLPQSELNKFKSKEKIYNTMLKYTYLKNIFIYCDDEKACLDMDTLVTDNENNKYIKFDEIKQISEMYSIRRKALVKNKNKNPVLRRFVRILAGPINLILKLEVDLSSSDRNSITINIEGNHKVNKENFIGALIFESDLHGMSKFEY